MTGARPRRLILTADDFGMAPAVNEAVERAHVDGILSAASLMVAGDAVADAVARAGRLPGLGVGLHLVLVDGRPVSPPETIPALVGPDGRFLPDPLRLGVRLYCSPAARRQAEAEIRAQLAAFAATGLRLDHVNAHHHVHLHPTVQRILLKLAGEGRLPAVRIPMEPPTASWRACRDKVLARWLGGAFYAARTRRLRRGLRRAGVTVNDACFGIADSGGMTAERLAALIAALPAGISEIYCHPATRHLRGVPSAYQPMAELAALLDPGIGAALRRHGLTPVRFQDLAVA